MKNRIVIRVPAAKPRNTIAVLARRRAAGAHTSEKRRESSERKDLQQRLRDAGL